LTTAIATTTLAAFQPDLEEHAMKNIAIALRSNRAR